MLSQLAWSYGAASTNTRSFGYDAVGRLSSIGFDLHGTSGDVTWGYTRNPASQILTETQSNDTYSWNGHVTIDRAYSTNGLNQYVSAGAAAFCYDANGNLTADGGSVYLYDVENRLVEKRVQGAGNTNCAALAYTGALQASLKYDPTGRLFEVSGGTLGTQRFAYDGNAMIGEYNSAGTLLRRYVHGSNIDADDPLIVYEGAAVSDATRRYLHADPRGSIIAVTNYQGTAIATNSYDEFGIPDSASGTDIASNGRFRYTGQAWLPELGMYYYKARIYSPTLGRFLQTDPIGYEDKFNLYAYVGNDPINGVDPSGLAEVRTHYKLTGSNRTHTASVTVDADFDNDGADDLSQGRLNKIGEQFSGFIRANDGADISDSGILISGDGSIADKTFTRVVSQFVGASGLAKGWDKVDQIDVSARNYWKSGADAYYKPYNDDPSRGVIFITGSPADWAGNYLYDSPSNMARALFHEVGHTPRGVEYNHFGVDQTARRNLIKSGLGGGGCWRYGPPGDGFPGC